ncbi:MAG TPA: biliverdin-producing heme oxygenase [Sinorhizobium sp.]|nr:biliverdin-producing heme oxygenase [Sinorhizobium sp.]
MNILERPISDDPQTASRAKRLKAATQTTHERLDRAIMAREPFASRDRYGLFARVQHAFHREIDALYDDETLDELLPDLAGRRRLHLIEQDLADLGMAPLAIDTAPTFGAGAVIDLPTALGWLYVAEGSNLGAAFLLKEAARLGLSGAFGARHLAGAPEGRGLHWRTFTAALDRIELDEQGEGRVVESASRAFTLVRSLVETRFE